MFEKEAEEIAKDIYIHHFDDDVDYPDVLKAIADNKANEWHYVKDRDLPEDDKIVLFYTTYFDFWIGGIEPKNDKKHRWEVLPSVSGDYYAEDEVIAWKEIVLPRRVNK